MIPCYTQFSTSQDAHLLASKYYMDGKYIIVGNVNGVITMYTARNLKIKATFLDEEIQKCGISVSSVIPFNKSLYCSYVNGIVKEWDIETKTCVHTFRTEPRSANSMAVDQNGKFVLTFNYDNKIRQYDFLKGKYIKSFTDRILSKKRCGHQRKICAIKFNPVIENEFISGGWDSMVHFWDLRMSNSFDYFDGAYICAEDGLDISADSRWVMAANFQKRKTAVIRTYQSPHERTLVIDVGQKMLMRLILPHDGIYAMDFYNIDPSLGSESIHAKIAVIHGRTLTEVTFLYKPKMSISDFDLFLR
uniref:WD_REPEATS_REGION domain-containing protein n=1 Tax=Rhodnius prolixus TaxID=13249 RepID=T1ICH3_RHOPR